MSLKIAILILMAYVLTPCAQAASELDCRSIDPDLIHCPPAQAPRIAELKSGFVVVSFTILPDGTVSSAEVVDADERGKWNSAAVEAVSHWRFKPSGEESHKSKRLEFGLAR